MKLIDIVQMNVQEQRCGGELHATDELATGQVRRFLRAGSLLHSAGDTAADGDADAIV